MFGKCTFPPKCLLSFCVFPHSSDSIQRVSMQRKKAAFSLPLTCTQVFHSLFYEFEWHMNASRVNEYCSILGPSHLMMELIQFLRMTWKFLEYFFNESFFHFFLLLRRQRTYFCLASQMPLLGFFPTIFCHCLDSNSGRICTAKRGHNSGPSEQPRPWHFE